MDTGLIDAKQVGSAKAEQIGGAEAGKRLDTGLIDAKQVGSAETEEVAATAPDSSQESAADESQVLSIGERWAEDSQLPF